MTNTFNSTSAFDALIAEAEKMNYIKKRFVRLPEMLQAFQECINEQLQENQPLTVATTEVIDLLFPAVMVVSDGRTMHKDFDLEVESILRKNGYPEDEDDE